MKVGKVKDTAESKQFWTYVEQTAREVRGWPQWMRGGSATQGTSGRVVGLKLGRSEAVVHSKSGSIATVEKPNQPSRRR